MHYFFYNNITFRQDYGVPILKFVKDGGSSLQPGFRSNHSCATTLMKTSDDVRTALDRVDTTFLVCFIFSGIK